jgi:uncharacterized membrane protein YozB (DUF420 family)
VTAESLPALNASLNGTSAVLLITGYLLIRRRHIRAHAWTMGIAFITSTLFLIGYLAHKAGGHERTSGLEAGWLRTVYFAILIPHVILAMVMLPMIVTTLVRAWRHQWEKHRRIAQPTFWIWLYVSVTGVIIYWMLYHLFPSLKAG